MGRGPRGSSENTQHSTPHTLPRPPPPFRVTPRSSRCRLALCDTRALKKR